MLAPTLKVKWQEGYTLFFDFETKDPDLLTRGSSYIWHPDFAVLMMGYAIDDGDEKVTTDIDEMIEILEGAGTLVAHHLFYELGICKYFGLDIKYKKVRCTKMGAILDFNQRRSQSLEYLAHSKFGISKGQDKIGHAVLNYVAEDGSRFFDYPAKYYVQVSNLKDEEKREKLATTKMKYQANKAKKAAKPIPAPYEDREAVLQLIVDEAREYIPKATANAVKGATKWAMGNLGIVMQICPEVVGDYCKSDVKITRLLDKLWLDKSGKEQYEEESDLVKICVEMRHKGVRIDIPRAERTRKILDGVALSLEHRARSNGWWCNYRSPKELPAMLLALGIDLPLTDKGNHSCTKAVLETIDHPVTNLITKWRRITNFRDNFVGKLIDWSHKGRIHGTMNNLGAAATGRFSHTAPNLGNIPSRDKVLGPALRGLFLPEIGEKWLHSDFSSQEPRLYVDLAIKAHNAKAKYKKQVWDPRTGGRVWDDKWTVFDCPMILDLQQRYIEDPGLDSHAYNQNLIFKITGIKLDRSTTKAQALGKAYGKGPKSTAIDLGVSEAEAKMFSKAFDDAAPFISMGSDLCKYRFETRKYIKTLGGRRNHYDGVGYRAYNYRVQGSARDQTAAALRILYYDHNMVMLTVVHDECNSSGQKEDGEILKNVMENAIKLEIPSKSDLCVGRSWGDAKG